MEIKIMLSTPRMISSPVSVARVIYVSGFCSNASNSNSIFSGGYYYVVHEQAILFTPALSFSL
jgi:hypothetical protein